MAEEEQTHERRMERARERRRICENFIEKFGKRGLDHIDVYRPYEKAIEYAYDTIKSIEGTTMGKHYNSYGFIICKSKQIALLDRVIRKESVSRPKLSKQKKHRFIRKRWDLIGKVDVARKAMDEFFNDNHQNWTVICVYGTGEHEQCLFIRKRKVVRLVEHDVRLYDANEHDAYVITPAVKFMLYTAI